MTTTISIIFCTPEGDEDAALFCGAYTDKSLAKRDCGRLNEDNPHTYWVEDANDNECQATFGTEETA